MRGLWKLWLTALVVSVAVFAAPVAHGEYGDVVFNKYSDKARMRPVVFPHWFHRLRFTCNVCHKETGFKMRAGSNDVTMGDIIDGKYCGMCHNGELAWGAENCSRCHSGLHGLAGGFYHSQFPDGGPPAEESILKRRH